MNIIKTSLITSFCMLYGGCGVQNQNQTVTYNQVSIKNSLLKLAGLEKNNLRQGSENIDYQFSCLNISPKIKDTENHYKAELYKLSDPKKELVYKNCEKMFPKYYTVKKQIIIEK